MERLTFNFPKVLGGLNLKGVSATTAIAAVSFSIIEQEVIQRPRSPQSAAFGTNY